MTLFERLKGYFDLHPDLIDEFCIEECGKKIKLDFPIILIAGTEYQDFVDVIGEEDIKRFGKVVPRTGKNVPDTLDFNVNAWLDDHCFSRKAFADWIESIPAPTEEEIDSHYTIDRKTGMVRYDPTDPHEKAAMRQRVRK